MSSSKHVDFDSDLALKAKKRTFAQWNAASKKVAALQASNAPQAAIDAAAAEESEAQQAFEKARDRWNLLTVGGARTGE